jgi:hypothetical protein
VAAKTTSKQNSNKGIGILRKMFDGRMATRWKMFADERLPHCTENLQHIFSEMKLHGLAPHFYIHVSGNELCIPMIGLIWNLYFPEQYCMRELSAQLQELREGQGTAAKLWLVTIPCHPIESWG